MTVPIIPSSKGVVFCHNCMSYQRDLTDYGVDDAVDQCDGSLIAHNSELKQFYIKCEPFMFIYEIY